QLVSPLVRQPLHPLSFPTRRSSDLIGNIATSGPSLKKVALELGGNSPFVVLDDANVEQAVKAAVFGKFLHQGQICMAINRIIVRSEEHTSELQSRFDLVCRLLLEKK